MTVTQDQIKNIIKNLSKLPDADKKIEWDVLNIIGYMEMLNEVDTTWVEPTVSVSNFIKPLREDTEVREINPTDLLNCSSQKVVSNQIVISNIMS